MQVVIRVIPGGGVMSKSGGGEWAVQTDRGQRESSAREWGKQAHLIIPSSERRIKVQVSVVG